MRDSCFPGRLILASASERRRFLLEREGFHFDVVEPEILEESEPLLGPIVSARRNALAKARWAAFKVLDGVVIGADTLVSCAGKILGKPGDKRDAFEILSALSGTTHEVITALALVDAKDSREAVDHEITRVTMRPLSEDEIRRYVESGEGLGKAGAFAVQETADRFIERLEGDFSNVVGFPLGLFRTLLKKFQEEKG